LGSLAVGLARWSFSFSARSRYSPTFFLIICFDFSFFSSVHRSALEAGKETGGLTFEGHHEVFEGLLVESICFLIVLFFIFFDCAFDYVNGFLLIRFRMRWEETARKSALDIVGKEEMDCGWCVGDCVDRQSCGLNRAKIASQIRFPRTYSHLHKSNSLTS
jgi:hypothetical protein